jgi:hypothetical protein
MNSNRASGEAERTRSGAASTSAAPTSPTPARARARGENAGLCDSCAFQRLVPNTRGSVFSLCERSRKDPAFVRYPRLPVLECPGYERRSDG